jgi:hypothetical protein
LEREGKVPCKVIARKNSNREDVLLDKVYKALLEDNGNPSSQISIECKAAVYRDFERYLLDLEDEGGKSGLYQHIALLPNKDFRQLSRVLRFTEDSSIARGVTSCLVREYEKDKSSLDNWLRLRTMSRLTYESMVEGPGDSVPVIPGAITVAPDVYLELDTTSKNEDGLKGREPLFPEIPPHPVSHPFFRPD